MKESILIVDDKQDMLDLLTRIITQKLDVSVLSSKSGEEALGIMHETGAGLVVTDVRMPGMDGLELLKRIKERNGDTIVIILTAHGTVDSAVEALKIGAYDFLTKPLNNERFIHTLKRAIEFRRVIREKNLLADRLKQARLVGSIIGNSPAIRSMLERIEMIADTDETVLITGETGTGKELAAQTIHTLSKRSKKKFVPVNCPALPESILESELFGYKKGAFTSAMSDKKGLFESANGGTIFLDEIGDIPIGIQTKLLRVIQEREFKPLGDTESIQIDVRVIASTNQDLEKKISQGLFREDLYYRLNVISVHMPSLRERSEDIMLLADYFLLEYSIEYDKEIHGFSDDAAAYLMNRTWKGNVRELQNIIKRAVIFAQEPVIDRSSLENPIRSNTINENIPDDILSLDYKAARNMTIEQFTVTYVRNILEKTGGNVTQAAKNAGIERQSFQHLMRKYNIRSDEFRHAE
jgi:DNA-binding NtrC family response regulator